MKLKCDEPLSNCAFNFNLRRYTEVAAQKALDEVIIPAAVKVGRCTG